MLSTGQENPRTLCGPTCISDYQKGRNPESLWEEGTMCYRSTVHLEAMELGLKGE